MAEQAIPAAHAETKLLMAPDNGPLEKRCLKAVSRRTLTTGGPALGWGGLGVRAQEGVHFTQEFVPSLRWLVEGHMVSITLVSSGSLLGWREVQVWLKCRPFLKLMGDHEIQSNIHSLAFSGDFANNLMTSLSLLPPVVFIWKWTQMYAERSGIILVSWSDPRQSGFVTATLTGKLTNLCSWILALNTPSYSHAGLWAFLWRLPVWQMDQT